MLQLFNLGVTSQSLQHGSTHGNRFAYIQCTNFFCVVISNFDVFRSKRNELKSFFPEHHNNVYCIALITYLQTPPSSLLKIFKAVTVKVPPRSRSSHGSASLFVLAQPPLNQSLLVFPSTAYAQIPWLTRRTSSQFYPKRCCSPQPCLHVL